MSATLRAWITRTKGGAARFAEQRKANNPAANQSPIPPGTLRRQYKIICIHDKSAGINNIMINHWRISLGLNQKLKLARKAGFLNQDAIF